KMKMAYWLVAVIVCLLSCSGEPVPRDIAGYHLDEPVQIIALDNALREISGLAYFNERLYALQDEDGRVYQIDPQTGKVLRDDKFWKDGDFEGIEVTDALGIAMKSNGHLYAFDLYDPDDDRTVKIDIELSRDMNFEGLGFDRQSGQILLAAKRRPEVIQKEIYAVDASFKSMQYRQMTILDQTVLFDRHMGGKKKGLARLRKNLAAATYSFNPSGIAVHPLTGDRFIISSPVPQLLVMSESWEVRDVIFLDQILFRQPEAICFDPAGNLYIGNEGGGAKGNILKFELHEAND
ncbi:MAG: SdiA-regulated domain-containing protein, partial [Saprospiraceae bacterium]|nr:SdiA-regulated domain-containing protein [Saprospiraceae bacterium]